MEYVKTQSYQKLRILDYNLNSLGLHFNQLVLDMINTGCFERLQILHLVNMSLGQFLANRNQSQSRLEWLRELGQRCELIEVDVSRNNL